MKRTFHQDKHELHGITVVVETTGPELYVGRCDDIDGETVVLLDVDVHREGEAETSREDYLQRAAQVGVFKRFDRLVLPSRTVDRIRPLGEL